MMSKLEIDWSTPQRQSPAALLILLYKALISLVKFLWPFLLLMILRKQSNGNKIDTYEIIALAASVFSVVRSVVEYYNFRFSATADELVIRKGFITKQTITLPLEKIQTIQAEQSWLHSLLNVSSISFDTAGSEKTEASIEALDKTRISALKEFIQGQRKDIQVTEVEQEQEKMLITLSGSDLFKLSISANHLEAFLLMLAFVYSSLQSAGVSDNDYSGVFKWLMDTFQTDSFKLLIILAVAVLVISIAISVIRVLLTYSDFMISRSAKGFRIRSGLINKKEKFVPFRKIQFISWKANWVRQKIGMFLLRFHATGSDHVKTKMQNNVPVTRASFIPILLEQYHPLLPVQELPAKKIHKAYIQRRVLLFGIIPVIAAGSVLFFYVQEKVLFILLWILVAWFFPWLFQRKFRLWPGTNALQIRKGIFGRHELILKWDKIQSVHLKQSLYQQKHNLATIELNTASGTVTIPFITLQESRQIQNYALYKMESSTWY